MAKIKYLLKLIVNMDYVNLFLIVNKTHTKTNKKRFLIFLDIVYCGLKYQAGYMDYYLFAMYDLNKKQRETILTRGKNNEIVKQLNDPLYNIYFNNKAEFNKKFNNYLNRDWLFINKYDDFLNFIKNKKEIFCKPLDLSCGKGIEKINTDNKNPKDLYDYLIKKNLFLIEEVAIQHNKLNELHPNSINTIRLITINNGINTTVVTGFLRIGNNNNFVDNFNNGGLTSKIDINSGTIYVPAIDKKGNLYNKHPLTNTKIVGFTIPMWNEVKKICIKAASVIPEVGYVAWDVCVGNEKPFLIEGNEYPGHDLYQLPPHRKNNIGVYPEFKKAIERGL